MLSDPLNLLRATVITSTDSPYEYSAMPDASPFFRDYRNAEEDASYKTVRNLRVGNYPTSVPNQRRIVVSKQVKKYDLVNAVDLPVRQITLSFVYDDRMVAADLTALKDGVKELAYLVANTTDGGLFDRIIAGEV